MIRSIHDRGTCDFIAALPDALEALRRLAAPCVNAQDPDAIEAFEALEIAWVAALRWRIAVNTSLAALAET